MDTESETEYLHQNPLSLEQMSLLVQLAASKQPATALEVGCGSGSFSVALALACPVQVVAFDTDEPSIDRARFAAASREVAKQIRFENRDARLFAEAPVDLAVCIGASHVYGTPREALGALHGLIRTGGWLVFADLVWAATPPKKFLEFLECPGDLYWAQNAASSEFAKAGYALTKEIVAPADSWRAFEESILSRRLRSAAKAPEAEGTALRDRANEWFGIYEKYGRYSFGFAAYIAHAR